MRASIGRISQFVLLLATLTVLLAGCAPAPLLRPLPPGSLGTSVEARQQIKAVFRGKERSLQVALKVAPDDLTLIGLSAIGQRLFTLSWNGDQAVMKGRLAGLTDLRPKRMLADLELAHWPLAALRGALTDPSMRIEQRGTVRALWQGDRLLWLAYSATPDRWASPMTIYNARLGYRLDIEPLALDAQSP